MLRLPFKKQRVIWEPDSDNEPTPRQEPQPYLPCHDRTEPRKMSPMLPHGSFNAPFNPEDLERSFGSLSTVALASEGEITDHGECTAPSSSSSAYGSASDGGATTTLTTLGESGLCRALNAPASSNKDEQDNPSARPRRRSRKERAARDARWMSSVPAQQPAVQIIDLTADTSSEDECFEIKRHGCLETSAVSDPVQSKAEVVNTFSFANNNSVVRVLNVTSESDTEGQEGMKQKVKFEVPVYQALCATYEHTRHPFDGIALIKYVQQDVNKKRKAIRVSNYRSRKAAQLQHEAPPAEDAVSAQPRPSGQQKRKRTTKSNPRKKRAAGTRNAHHYINAKQRSRGRDAFCCL
ncbi:hypothetical protein QAD02_009970 [Eretmocerus hayati]|uniref:Uncharacterized protein n=1 Tax=Eretmocerus hayati TaxID=131215 RepID=A0ACC2ND80_9HYME|nr:hypothetical protein QAD02_009970 [Eretmocerus hayati]